MTWEDLKYLLAGIGLIVATFLLALGMLLAAAWKPWMAIK